MKNSKNITKLSMFQKKYLNQLLDLNIEENDIYEEADGVHDSISDIRETKDIDLENEKNKYWQKRCQDARIWALILNISNMTYVYEAIVSPYQDRHFYVNIFYLIIHIIIFSLIIASYCFKKQMI
jgi:hypothetical protein